MAFTENIRKIYFYAVSLVSLMMIIIASVSLINLALRTWVLQKADMNYYGYACPATAQAPSNAIVGSGDQNNVKSVPCDVNTQMQQQKDQLTSQHESTAAQDIALLLIGIPVFLYHWKRVNKEV